MFLKTKKLQMNIYVNYKFKTFLSNVSFVLTLKLTKKAF